MHTGMRGRGREGGIGEMEKTTRERLPMHVCNVQAKDDVREREGRW